MNNKLLLAFIIQILMVSLLFYAPLVVFAQDAEYLMNLQLFKAKEAFKLGKIDDAVKALKDAKEIDRTSARPYVALGELYRITRKYDYAIEEYKEALKLEATSAELYKLLGDVFILKAVAIENKEISGNALSERKEASATYEKVFDLTFTKDDKGRKREICKALIDNYDSMGEYTSALTVVEKWRRIAPDDPEANFAAGEVYLGKKDLRKAREEFSRARESVHSSDNLKSLALDKLNLVASEEKKTMMTYIKIGGIGVAVLIGVIIGVFSMMKSKSGKEEFAEERRERERDRDRDRDESLEDLNTFEGICRMAMRKLMHLTLMPKGVIFLPNDEETLLVPQVSSGMDRDVENLEYSALDTRDWIVEREGMPFIFKLERREVSFSRAFPDSGSILGEQEMRVGVPLMMDNNFLGIGYFGCPESKDKTKFRKLYEQNRPLIIKVAQEISELLNDLISRKQAITDTLTGLYNEKYFNETFPQMIDEARKKSKTCSLVLVAIDGYKDLMETFGEDYGEKLIKLSAIALNTAVTGTDSLLCRLRDTVFAVVYPEASMDVANELTEKLKEEISSVKIARHIPPATASIALGTFPATAIYAEKLVELVHDALEKAQGEGGNRVQLAEKKLRTMETTKMTRDQVLAAVERRRQVRKAMSTAPEEAQDDIVAPRGMPEQHGYSREPEPPPAEAEPRPAPRTAPWLAPQQAPRSQPVAPIHIDVRDRQEEEPQFGDEMAQGYPPRGMSAQEGGGPRDPQRDAHSREEAAPPYEPQRDMPGRRAEGMHGQGPQKRPLSIGPKGEDMDRQKPVSPFMRRTSGQAPEGAPENVAVRGQAMPPASRQDAGSLMAEMRMEGGGRQDVHGQQEAHMAQNPRVKPGGPAGPLDFSKEMRTIDQRERETPMRPISPQGAKAPQAAEGMRAQPFAGVAQRGPEGAPRPQGRPLARGAAPQAQENVTSDPLTGFYHRSYFEKVLISEAQKLKQNPGDCTLLYFGLDNFEQLKSRHGSPKLRKVIKDITEQLKIQMDEGGGIPGRIEENGFALFLPYTSLPAGNDLANRLRQTVSSFRSPELAQPLSISIGISSYPQTVRNFREIVVNSRKAMEKAMKSGGNRAEVGSFS